MTDGVFRVKEVATNFENCPECIGVVADLMGIPAAIALAPARVHLTCRPSVQYPVSIQQRNGFEVQRARYLFAAYNLPAIHAYRALRNKPSKLKFG